MHSGQVVFIVSHEMLGAEVAVCDKSDVTQKMCMAAHSFYAFNMSQ